MPDPQTQQTLDDIQRRLAAIESPPQPPATRLAFLSALDGYKTYICAGLGVVVVALNIAGVITADQMQHLLDVLGLGAFASIRSAIAKNAAAIAEVKP